MEGQRDGGRERWRDGASAERLSTAILLMISLGIVAQKAGI